MMKIILYFLLSLCLNSSFAQKLNVGLLEKLLYSSVSSADSLLKKSNFKLADKESGQGYDNYYYTSQEIVEKSKQLLRSLSFMDVYSDGDTSRLILYRTYYQSDQEEITKQLLAAGYELSKRTENNLVYRKGDHIISNKMTEKNVAGGKPVTSYEFELGR